MATILGIEATPDELKALALTGYGHFTSMHVEEGGVRASSFTWIAWSATRKPSSTPISTESRW